jgi:hypothetical protein
VDSLGQDLVAWDQELDPELDYPNQVGMGQVHRQILDQDCMLWGDNL